MRRMRIVTSLVVAAALAGATASCGDVVRDGGSPVFLTIDALTSGDGENVLLSDVLTDEGSIFNDLGSVRLRSVPRNITLEGTPFAPTSNSDVTIRRYRVTYRRADGRNTPGVDVPYGFDGAVTATIPVNGSGAFGFELVRHVAKMEPPLAELQVNLPVITTIAEVTFYGEDRVGNEVSVTGFIQVNFGNFAG